MTIVTTAAESRELDRVAIEVFGLAGLVLMENAARSILDRALQFWPRLNRPGLKVTILCGPGQNGGDGWVLARLLSALGHEIKCYLVTKPGRKPSGDAAKNLAVCRRLGLDPVIVATDEDPLPDWSWPDLVIDSVFGTGLDRPLSGQAFRVLASMAQIRRSMRRFKVLAVDLPSGLNGDTGAAEVVVLAADLTVSLGSIKAGLLMGRGPELAGTVQLGDIGLCPPMIEAAAPKGRLLDTALARTLVPARPMGGHKGTFGHAFLLGGSPGKTGALELASIGALRSGCGLVTCGHPASLTAVYQGKLTEAMTLALPEDPNHEMTLDASEMIQKAIALKAPSAVAIGPGLGLGAGPEALVRFLARDLFRPMVLDADALSALEGSIEILKEAPLYRIITPHPGEAGRLLGVSTADIEADRLGSARALAARSGAVTVLKGLHTIVAEPSGRYHVNVGGGPVLAAGGSGDLLTGLLGGLLAQGLPALNAALLAVHLHTLAADLAAPRQGAPTGLTIGDVARAIPRAWRKLTREDPRAERPLAR